MTFQLYLVYLSGLTWATYLAPFCPTPLVPLVPVETSASHHDGCELNFVGLVSLPFGCRRTFL
ncbi:hypothetical protein JZ751_004857 [Albula glossodonta]|uniref:Secreted protein n=1 Tax=Albula glossodonta TaxID=121402 RepID=A0A8T2P629_9TELE|nr:hypothetical protein JZ751_004857 [Albula glossodonta]